MDHATQHAGTDAADGFVDGNDAAHFGGIGIFRAEQFERGIGHLDAAGTVRIEIGFAVHHDALTRAQAPLEIATVKKFARQHTGLVAHQQVIDGSPAAAQAGQAAIGHRTLNGISRAGNQRVNPGEVNAILVAERQIVEQIADGRDTARRQKSGSLRPNTLQIFHFACGSQIHRAAGYLYHPAGRRSHGRTKLVCGRMTSRTDPYLHWRQTYG